MKPILLTPRAVLFQGEAKAIADKLPPESVDAIITDPPAGIGFMGKSWDSDKGGRDAWIAWLADQLAGAFRVLKPGGHALVWALPRTSHWTAMALEHAGFEIRDRVSHLFGCVPLGTEILTANGWRKCNEIRTGDPVVEVDAVGRASLAPLQGVSVYPYAGDMIRVKTRSTEQVLTPGHTVHAYAKRGRWKHTVTDSALSSMPADVLIENTPGTVGWVLPLAARGAEVRASLGSVDLASLIGWVVTEGHFHRDVEAVSIYQNEGVDADRIRALLARLGIAFSEYRRTRDNYDGTPRDSVQWYLKVGAWSTWLRTLLAGDKPTPPEWLAWLPIDEARALFEALVDGDGSRHSDTSGAWYQKRPAVRAWFQTLCFRLGFRTSENVSKSAISWCMVDSTEVQRGSHRKRWASTVPSDGAVWCPTVPSGRWVARYRGSVFVTGNTGFPKSMSVSKAIDKALGADRIPGGSSNTNCAYIRSGVACRGHGEETSQAGQTIHTPGTTAGSPEAAAWDGWGTALKPACEDWWLVRKPFKGTVAANVLTHGTGGLNIDACRIGTSKEVGFDPNVGRWPANVTFDEATAAMLDASVPPSKSTKRTQTGSRARSMSNENVKGGFAMTDGSTSYEDSGVPSRFYYVAKPSRREKDAGLAEAGLEPKTGGEATGRKDDSAGTKNPRAGAGRTGGARNSHPTVKSIALMTWLIKLITPPGGVVLDPFAGSGSTGVAALLSGFRFVGVELGDGDDGARHIAIAKARLEHAMKPEPAPDPALVDELNSLLNPNR